MLCAIEQSPGVLQLVVPTVVDATSCPFVVSSFGEIDPAALGVTAGSIAYVYAWGVGAVLALWVIGYAVGVAVRVIRAA